MCVCGLRAQIIANAKELAPSDDHPIEVCTKRYLATPVGHHHHPLVMPTYYFQALVFQIRPDGKRTGIAWSRPVRGNTESALMDLCNRLEDVIDLPIPQSQLS